MIHWCDPRQNPARWVTRNLSLKQRSSAYQLYPNQLSITDNGEDLLVGFALQGGWRTADKVDVLSLSWSWHVARCRIDSRKAAQILDLDSLLWALEFAPDNQRWARRQGLDDHSKIVLCDGLNKPLREAKVPGKQTGCLRFSPDGRSLATMTTKRSVTVLTADTLEIVAALEADVKKHVTDFAFTPDGSSLGTVDVLLCFVVRSCTRFFAS
jgi:WD40 repeat protein